MNISVIYPAREGARFDFDYYRDSHTPQVLEAWGHPSHEVVRGMPGPDGSAPPFALIATFRFPSQAALMQALSSPGTPELTKDVANFTDITPQMLFSERLAGDAA